VTLIIDSYIYIYFYKTSVVAYLSSTARCRAIQTPGDNHGRKYLCHVSFFKSIVNTCTNTKLFSNIGEAFFKRTNLNTHACLLSYIVHCIETTMKLVFLLLVTLPLFAIAELKHITEDSSSPDDASQQVSYIFFVEASHENGFCRVCCC
jgi:hypothetical protein